MVPFEPMRPLKKAGIRRLQEQAAIDHPQRAKVAFLLQDLDDPVNVGAIFRIADALGALEVIMAGETPTPPHPGISLTARGCERRVPWRQIKKIDDAMPALKEDGYHLVALELTTDAQVFLDYAYPEKVCIVLGAEGAGVWPKTLRQCDGTVFIPMYGKHPSLNVHVSAAILGYHVVSGGGTTAPR